MQVLVYGRTFKTTDALYVQQLFDALHEAGITTYVFTPYLEEMQGQIRFKRDVGKFDSHLDFKVRHIDAVITMGGDGTILNAATLVRDSQVPILGVNLGRLGFLASVGKHYIRQMVQALLQSTYVIEERRMLCLESNFPLFGEENFALNDFTILKRDTSSMIIIHTYVNGEFLNSYWADGIIVATPTGSTGYSLSCGGPIIFPNSGNFVITPVAPHNLNVRPIVISDEAVISFEIEGRAENFLCTLDSRFETIASEHQLAVRKADFCIQLMRLEDRGFLWTIREKLTWGNDVRN